MNSCRWFKEVEALVDGEAQDPQAVETHVSGCATCSDHRAGLLRWREALAPAISAPVLSDQQFPAFMEGIRAGINEPRPRVGGIWAMLSLATAALVIAVATFYMFSTPAPAPVSANEVESLSTDIEGATVGVENGDNSVTTIWISIGEDDV